MPDRKPLIASDWLAGCAGCHMSLLDMDERILDVLALATLTSTPITDLKHPPATGVDVGVLEGAVVNSANEDVAKLMRQRCKVLVALGDCACFGGVPALRNSVSYADAARRAYVETESTADGAVPTDPALARARQAKPLDQVVKVDAYVPGCPPSADAIFAALVALAQGKTPTLPKELLDWH